MSRRLASAPAARAAASGQSSGQAHRSARVALADRRRRMAAAFVSEGQLRAAFEARIFGDYPHPSAADPGARVGAAARRPLPMTGSRRAPTPLIVELVANAPAAMLAAIEAAIEAVAPLVAVDLVRVPSWASDEQLRIRGPWVAWDAPASVQRRQARAMVAFAAALDATLAVAGDSGDRA